MWNLVIFILLLTFVIVGSLILYRRDTKLAYLAGLLDAKGASNLSRPSKSHVTFVAFTSRKKSQAELFAQEFGGRINEEGGKRWRWNVSGPNAVKCIEALKPYRQ